VDFIDSLLFNGILVSISISMILRVSGIFRWLALCALCWASSGCAAQTTVHFEGEITDESVARFSDLLASSEYQSAQWVEITSAGGDALAGMKMARLIRYRNLGVRVRGYCVSACAQYVFLAARNRHVLDGGVVLFHDNLAMIWQLHKNGGSKDGEATFAPLAVKESEFMSEIGAKSTLTKLSVTGLEPVCIYDDVRFQKNDPRRCGYASRYVAYAVPREIIGN